MLTGDLKSKIDQIWNAFWSGGIANPIEVIKQITYLLFLRRLDDLQTLEENKAARLGTPLQRRIFPEGADPRARPFEDLRWSRFKNQSPAEMFTVVGEHVFPFLRTLGVNGTNEGSTHRAALAELDALFASLQQRAFAGSLCVTVSAYFLRYRCKK